MDKLPLADDGIVVLGEVAGVLGSGQADHLLDPVPIAVLEPRQGQNHVLTRTIITGTKQSR